MPCLAAYICACMAHSLMHACHLACVVLASAVVFSCLKRAKRKLKQQGGQLAAETRKVEIWAIGMLCNNRVRLMVIERGLNSVNRDVCTGFVLHCTKPGSVIVTDASKVYSPRLLRQHGRLSIKVNHKKKQWVHDRLRDARGVRVGSNPIESEFGKLRALMEAWGVYNAVEETDA